MILICKKSSLKIQFTLGNNPVLGSPLMNTIAQKAIEMILGIL